MKILTSLMLPLLMLSPAIQAAESDLWGNFGGVSKHFSPVNRNEVNLGFGFEKEYSGFNLMAGLYRNSVNKTSRYLVAEKILYRTGALGFGALAGFVDGYGLNDGGFIPVVSPTMTIEHNGYGVRFMYTPEIKGSAAAVVSLQLRVKLFSGAT